MDNNQVLEEELALYLKKYYNCIYPDQVDDGTASETVGHVVAAARHFFSVGHYEGMSSMAKFAFDEK